MRKYIRVKVGSTTYKISQITGNIYYNTADGMMRSDFNSIAYCQKIVAEQALSSWWIRKAKAILDGYEDVRLGRVKKHAVDVF